MQKDGLAYSSWTPTFSRPEVGLMMSLHDGELTIESYMEDVRSENPLTS